MIASNTKISKGGMSTLEDKRSISSSSGVVKIFVVEEIQLKERKTTNQIKYGQELIDPCLKPFAKLFFWDIGYVLAIILACVLWSVPITIIGNRTTNRGVEAKKHAQTEDRCSEGHLKNLKYV